MESVIIGVAAIAIMELVLYVRGRRYRKGMATLADVTTQIRIAAALEKQSRELPLARRTPRPRRHLCVLVVDDDIGLTKACRRILEGEGYCVRTAFDGAEALEILWQHEPSVILLDLEMAGMSGWRFRSEMVRRDIDTTPVVLMSGVPHLSDIAACLGAVGWLQKPRVGPSDLMGVLGRLGVVAHDCPHQKEPT